MTKSKKASPEPNTQPARKPNTKVWVVALTVTAVAAAAVVILGLRPGGHEVRREIGSALASGSAAGFNVVVVTLDTTRADHMGCYGRAQAQTPVFDKLAGEGIRFADAVSPVPLTLVSHASIFTGLDPISHGVRNNGEYRLEDSQITLAEVLKQNGYDTAAFVSAFVLDQRFGMAQGFDVYNDDVEPKPGGGQGGFASERRGELVTNAALNWLEGRETNKPFLLWVHYFDPHNDYIPPGDFAVRFASNPYDGEIAYMDSQLGRLVEAVGHADESKKTLIVLMGDHGESLGEHEEATHSHSIYDATQHVPLVIWCPTLFEGPYLVDDAVVSLVDVFPTLLDVLGIQNPIKTDGMTLRRCQENPARAVYIETMATYLDNGWSPLHGLRRHNDKYILAPRPEYYDLRSDPDELDNLLEKNASDSVEQAASQLATALNERMKDAPSPAEVAAAATELDDDALQKLQALGYLVGGATADASDSLPDPKDMMPIIGQLGKAQTLRKAGRLQEAESDLRGILAWAGEDPSVLRELGILYLQTQRLTEAELVFRRAIAAKPTSNVCQMLAQVVTRKGRYDEADALLDQALSIEPDHGGSMIAKGDLCALRGNRDQALQWYQRAEREDPVRAKSLAQNRISRLLSQP